MAGEITRFPAIVSDNRDPEQLGRLLLEIPALMGEDDPVHPDWINPRVAAAGPNAVGFLFLPPIGAAIYVERDLGGDLSWRGADFGKRNQIPPDLRTNYPRRSGWSSPSGRHVVAMDEDSGYLAIVEDDSLGAPGARSYLSIGANGTLTLAGARGGLLFLGPDGTFLGSADSSLLNMPNGGEIQLVHSGGTEFVTLGGGLTRVAGGTVAISAAGQIQLGDGVAPPTNAYLLTTPFFPDLLNAFAEIIAIFAPGITPATPTPLPNCSGLVAKIGISQGAGTPYLSTKIMGS